jgi:hypothetical protein
MADNEKQAAELAAFSAKYGDEIAAFASSFGWLVFKRPDQEAYEDFVELAASDKGKKTVATRSLALRCVLEPSRESLIEIFKKRPGLPLRISARLAEMCSEDLEDAAKKG